MGETSVFYVPDSSASWTGRAREAAEYFWHLGLFMKTEDDFIAARLCEFAERGEAVPACRHAVTYAGMGIEDPGEPVPVPYRIWHLACPRCDADVLDLAYQAWSSVQDVPLPERVVVCPACGIRTPSSSLRSNNGFTFAPFYVWVSDIDEENWDPSFKESVERVLGPCREYRLWDT